MKQINRNEMELVAQITNEIELSREVIMFCLSFSPTSLTHGIFPNKRTQEEEEDEQHLSHDSLYHSLTLSSHSQRYEMSLSRNPKHNRLSLYWCLSFLLFCFFLSLSLTEQAGFFSFVACFVNKGHTYVRCRCVYLSLTNTQ